MKVSITLLHEGKTFKSKAGDYMKEVTVLLKIGDFEQVQKYYVVTAKGKKA